MNIEMQIVCARALVLMIRYSRPSRYFMKQMTNRYCALVTS